MGDHSSPPNSPAGKSWGVLKKILGSLSSQFTSSDPITKDDSVSSSNSNITKKTVIEQVNAAEDKAGHASTKASPRSANPYPKMSIENLIHGGSDMSNLQSGNLCDPVRTLHEGADASSKELVSPRQSGDPNTLSLPSSPTAIGSRERDNKNKEKGDAVFEISKAESVNPVNRTSPLERPASRVLDEDDLSSDVEITAEFYTAPKPSSFYQFAKETASFKSHSSHMSKSPPKTLSSISTAAKKSEPINEAFPIDISYKKPTRQVRVVESNRKRRIFAPSSDSEEDILQEPISTNIQESPVSPGSLGELRYHNKDKDVEFKSQHNISFFPGGNSPVLNETSPELELSQNVPRAEYAQPGSAVFLKYDAEFPKILEQNGFREPSIDSLEAKIAEWSKMTFDKAEFDESAQARSRIEAQLVLEAHPDIFGEQIDWSSKTSPKPQNSDHEGRTLGSDDDLLPGTTENSKTPSLSFPKPPENHSEEGPKIVGNLSRTHPPDGLSKTSSDHENAMRTQPSLNLQSARNRNVGRKMIDHDPKVDSSHEGTHIESALSVVGVSKSTSLPKYHARSLDIELKTPLIDDSFVAPSVDTNSEMTKQMIHNKKRKAGTTRELERKKRKMESINSGIQNSKTSSSRNGAEENPENLPNRNGARVSLLPKPVALERGEVTHERSGQPHYQSRHENPPINTISQPNTEISESFSDDMILNNSETAHRKAFFAHSSLPRTASPTLNKSGDIGDNMGVDVISLGVLRGNSAEDLHLQGNSSTQIPRTLQDSQTTHDSRLLSNETLFHLDAENSIVIPNSSQSVKASQRSNPLASQIAVNSSQDSHVNSSITSISQTSRAHL